MDFDKLFQSNLISLAELARLLWPGNKGARVKLMNKIASRQGQRITDADKANIEKIVRKYFEDIIK